MAKTVYNPTQIAKDIRNVVSNSETPMSFAQIQVAMGDTKIGTATVTALVNNGYLVVSEVRDVTCPCCGTTKKNVKFYSATEKAI